MYIYQIVQSCVQIDMEVLNIDMVCMIAFDETIITVHNSLFMKVNILLLSRIIMLRPEKI